MNKSLRTLSLVFILAAFFAGCSKKEKCNYDPCAIKAPAAEIQSVKDFLASKNITNAVEHCSGAYYVVNNGGNGKNPTGCSYVSVKYTGSLTSGYVFDQGSFSSGLDRLIIGWRSVLPEIKEGGTITMYLPPSLGYGATANGPIPANSILIFTIDLYSVAD